MAVDKKSDHYTSSEGYTDLDGLSRQFTFVDHDKKTTISFSNEGSTFDAKEYRSELLRRITSISAKLCPLPFRLFTVNGEYEEWNMDMLLDAGLSSNRLRDLCVLLENTLEYGNSDDIGQILT